MSTIRFFATACALGLVVGAALAPRAARAADELPAVATDRLATPEQIDAVRLNLVDDKLALTLAAESQIQIGLAELGLSGIRHDDLRRLTEKKLRLYHQLFDTLEELSGGQTGRQLAKASHKTPAATANATTDFEPAADRDPRKPARRGGMNDVLQNVATQAVLRVRLEIADEYAGQVRAELSAAPPDEYDRRYADIEAHDQMQVLAMLRVFERQASDPFARIIHAATVAAESYAAEIRQLNEQLKSAPRVPPIGKTEIVNAAPTASP